MQFQLNKKETITDEDIIEEMKSVMKKLGKTKLCSACNEAKGNL